MKQKVCKNKNCQKPLPEGYKYKYCEACRNKHADNVKKVGKPALGVAVLAVVSIGAKVLKGIIKR